MQSNETDPLPIEKQRFSFKGKRLLVGENESQKKIKQYL
jgi:hypothetical protein